MITIATKIGEYTFTDQELEKIAEQKILLKQDNHRFNKLKELVLHYHGLTDDQLTSRTRKRQIVEARHLLMFLIKEHTDYSLLRIGQLLGGFDHSSVIHAIDNMKGLISVDAPTKTAYKFVSEQFLASI